MQQAAAAATAAKEEAFRLQRAQHESKVAEMAERQAHALERAAAKARAKEEAEAAARAKLSNTKRRIRRAGTDALRELLECKTAAELKKAFRRSALLLHPDQSARHWGKEPEVVEKVTKTFQSLQGEYEKQLRSVSSGGGRRR